MARVGVSSFPVQAICCGDGNCWVEKLNLKYEWHIRQLRCEIQQLHEELRQMSISNVSRERMERNVLLVPQPEHNFTTESCRKRRQPIDGEKIRIINTTKYSFFLTYRGYGGCKSSEGRTKWESLIACSNSRERRIHANSSRKEHQRTNDTQLDRCAAENSAPITLDDITGTFNFN